MHEEPALLRHQHDVAWNQRMGGSGLDTQNVARPDRRQHAGSLSLQAYGVACAENFRGKLKFVVESEEEIVAGGEAFVIPPNAAHSVEALEDTVVMDLFSKPRA